MKSIAQILFIALFLPSLSSCGQKKEAQTKSGKIQIKAIIDGLEHPWGMDFLPDGRILITERSGNLRIMNPDSSLSDPIQGTPEVVAKGQGGLLDVKLDPDFESNNFIYLTYSEPGENSTASTAVGRGKFNNNQISDFKVLFSQVPKIEGSNHFGSRIVFHEEYLYLTTGERFKFKPSQDLNTHLGKIIRINPDGTIPQDNPYIGDANAKDEIWSYGHRNIQSAAIDPASGILWVAEFGPKGGDELNYIEKKENYGWPKVSWGNHYDGGKIPDPSPNDGFKDAVIKWTPVISPSGMDFYSGEMFPEWQGKMLIGGLSSKAMVIVETNGKNAKEVDRVDIGSRIRDVQVAKDGSIYLLTDESNGKVLRLSKE